jgi:hypothetical protein
MFIDGVLPEFIPERIYDLIRLVSTREITITDAEEALEPLSLNKTYEYFNPVCNAAVELGLIKKENNNLIYIGDDSIIKSIDEFRKYCNSKIWKDENSSFYKITKAYIQSDYQFLNDDSILSPIVNAYIREKTNNDSNADVKRLRGHRFWLSFLGLGYIQELNTVIYFLPNMYVALKDFMELSSLEKNKEYSIAEFLDEISKVSNIWRSGKESTLQLSAALSCALRTLHDKHEITLKRNLDSKEVWRMTRSETHTFTEITHLIIGGK